MRSAVVSLGAAALLLAAACGHNRRPTAPYLTGPVTVAVADTATYSVMSTDPEGDDIRYRVTWQDGASPESTGLFPPGETVNLPHCWQVPGRYVVRAQAVDMRGARSNWSDSLLVNVLADSTNRAPARPDLWGEDTVDAGAAAAFFVASVDPDTDNIYFRLDWGGGSAAESTVLGRSGDTVAVLHGWQTAGRYAVRAQAVDRHGAESGWTAAHWVTVRADTLPNRAPYKPLLMGPTTARPGDTASFSVATNDPELDSLYYTVEWGDGVAETTALVRSGVMLNLRHAWQQPGTYPVRAAAVDQFGARSPWSDTLLVAVRPDTGGNRPPGQPLLWGADSLGAGDTGAFFTLAADPDTDRVYYRLRWGVGAVESTGLVAPGDTAALAHAWQSAGQYAVTAQAVDEHGAESGWSDTLIVNVTPAAGRYPDSLALVVPTGGTPFGICLLPDGSRAYVPVRDEETVVINTATNTVAARIATPGYPSFAAASPDGQYVYVTARYAGVVYVVRASDNSVVGTAGVAEAWGIAVTPDGAYAYVTQYGLGTVSVVRLADRTVVASVPVGAHPWGVCIGADGEYAYVAGRETGRVYVIRTADNVLHTSVTVPTGPIGVAAAPDGRSVWFTCGPAGVVGRIKTADHSLGEVLYVGGHPSGVAVMPDGGHVFAARYTGGSLKVVSSATNGIVDDLYCGGEYPDYVAFTPDLARAYVTQGSSDGVMVFVVSGGRR